MTPTPARVAQPAVLTPATETSIGLNRKRAALLAYSAGWVTGLLVLWLEGQDRETRWHAAQSVLGFGGLTVLACVCGGVAMLGLLSSLTLFRAGLWAAQAVVFAGVVLWVWTMAQVAFGGTPRWPLIGARVERLAVLS